MTKTDGGSAQRRSGGRWVGGRVSAAGPMPAGRDLSAYLIIIYLHPNFSKTKWLDPLPLKSDEPGSRSAPADSGQGKRLLICWQ